MLFNFWKAFLDFRENDSIKLLYQYIPKTLAV